MGVLKLIGVALLRTFGFLMVLIGMKQQSDGFIGYGYTSIIIGLVVLYFSLRRWLRKRRGN